MIKRRQFTRKEKLQILEQLKSRPLSEVANEHQIHANQISRWKREFEANPSKAFSGHGKICKLEAEVASYQRLVGKLYAQNDFLKKVLETLKMKLAEEKLKQS